ncbi:MAG: hypothetical protein K6E61_08235 [Bacteroidales bacterium]|nr:hypothetical protein [Bacteroidales bacterium]
MVLLNTALCWTGALMGSPAVLAVIQILISFSCVLFVITALHPNRSREVADRTGYSRTYISGLVKSELGGFVNYVNRPTYYSMKSKIDQ